VSKIYSQSYLGIYSGREVSAVPDILALHAEATPEKVAVIDPANNTTTTFSQLNATVNQLCAAFDSLGTNHGERLVWCGPNSTGVLVTIHAARKSGLVAVPLSYRFNGEEMAYIINNSGATVVVTDSEQVPILSPHLDQMPGVNHWISFDGPTHPEFANFDELLNSKSTDEPQEPNKEELSAAGSSMIYTSGTTGKPKGALRTTSDTETVLALLIDLGLHGGDQVHLTTGPLYHSGPLAFASMTHSMGCPIVLLRKFDPSQWLRYVTDYRVTDTFSAPTQLKHIVNLSDDELSKADMKSMKCLIANAAPVPYALKQEIIKKLGEGFLFEVYGSTELGVVTVLKPEDQLRKPGSCGRPYGPIQVRIIRDDGSEADVDEPGELFISTRLAMDGYHETEEKLQETLDGNWKSVGDIASVDSEGYVSIRDRKKDMIISGGMNIYPAEIEAVLHEHPQVLDAAVFGIPDDEWGESVYCIVSPRSEGDLDLEELQAFAVSRLAKYKCPRGYEIRSELPRTEAGKLLKRQLRDEFWVGRDQKV